MSDFKEELNDSDNCNGSEIEYDNLAVASIALDATQFELPEDFDIEEEDDE